MGRSPIKDACAAAKAYLALGKWGSYEDPNPQCVMEKQRRDGGKPDGYTPDTALGLDSVQVGLFCQVAPNRD